MSNIIPFVSTGVAEVPAHLAALFDGDSNIAPRFTINQLSYRGKIWRRIVEGEETVLTRVNNETGEEEPMPIVSLVILDQNRNRSRAFYAGSYEEGKNAAPDCYSGDGVTPDASVKEPCSETCATCPNAVKGSKITESGKQTTLCSPFKRIAVVPSQHVGQHPPMLLRIAQTSVWDKDNAENEAKGWYAYDQYVDMLRARGAKHTAVVETKVKFDMRTAYPKLLFSASRWLNPDEAAAAKQLLATDAVAIKDILTGGGADGVMGTPAHAPAADGADTAAAAPAAKAPKATKPAVDPAVAAAAAAAKVKADAKAARIAAAQAALEAAAADDDDDNPAPAAAAAPKTTPKATKPAAQPQAPEPETPAATGTTVVSGAPSELGALLAGWDDDDK